MGGYYEHLNVTDQNWEQVLQPETWQYKDIEKHAKESPHEKHRFN